MKNRFNRKLSRPWAIFWWILTVLWVGVLFFFSGQNGTDSGRLSDRLAAFLMSRFWFIQCGPGFLAYVLRKIAHFCIFALEGFLMRCAFYNTVPSHLPGMLATAALGGGLSVLNELHQLTSEGRACSPVDMLIDFSGAVTGMLAASLLCWIAESIHVRRQYLEITNTQKQ